MRIRITVNGIVQGVGFRPFLHRLAEKYHTGGWVRNTSDGLEGVLDKGYGILAQLKMPVWFFPIIILGPISIHRVSRRRKTEQATE